MASKSRNQHLTHRFSPWSKLFFGTIITARARLRLLDGAAHMAAAPQCRCRRRRHRHPCYGSRGGVVVVVATGGYSGGGGSNQGATRAVCETAAAARRRRNNAQSGGNSRNSSAAAAAPAPNHANHTNFALKITYITQPQLASPNHTKPRLIWSM